MGMIVTVPGYRVSEAEDGRAGAVIHRLVEDPACYSMKVSGIGITVDADRISRRDGTPTGCVEIELPDEDAEIGVWDPDSPGRKPRPYGIQARYVAEGMARYEAVSVQGVPAEDVREAGNGVREVALRYEDGSVLRFEADSRQVHEASDGMMDVTFRDCGGTCRAVLETASGEERRGFAFRGDLVKAAGKAFGRPLKGDPMDLLHAPEMEAGKSVLLARVPADGVRQEKDGVSVDLPSTRITDMDDAHFASRSRGYEEIRIFPDSCTVRPGPDDPEAPGYGFVDVEIPADAPIRVAAVPRAEGRASRAEPWTGRWFWGWKDGELFQDDDHMAYGLIRPEDLAAAWEHGEDGSELSVRRFGAAAMMHCARGMGRALLEVPVSGIVRDTDPETGEERVRVRMAEPAEDGSTWYVHADPARMDGSRDKHGFAVPGRVDVFLGDVVRWESEGPEGVAQGDVHSRYVAETYNLVPRDRAYDRFGREWNGSREAFEDVPREERPERCGLPVMHGIPDELFRPCGERSGNMMVLRLPWKDGEGWIADLFLSSDFMDCLDHMSGSVSLDGKGNEAEGFRDVTVEPGAKCAARLMRIGRDGLPEVRETELGSAEAMERWNRSRAEFGFGKELFAEKAADSVEPGVVRNAWIREKIVDGEARPFASAKLMRDGKPSWAHFFVDDPGISLESVRTDGGKRFASVRLPGRTDVYFGRMEEGSVPMAAKDIEAAREAAVPSGIVRGAEIRTKSVDGKDRPFASARFMKDGKAVWGHFFVDVAGVSSDPERVDARGRKFASATLPGITEVYFGKYEDGAFPMEPKDLQEMRDAAIALERQAAAKARPLPGVPAEIRTEEHGGFVS